MAQDGLKLRRRTLLAAAAVSAGCARNAQFAPDAPGRSPVFIAKAASYNSDLRSVIERGVRSFGLDVRGKNVLLKPNLVEFDRATSINTNVAVIAAALEVFRKLGAASVRIAEGPGHRRDSLFLAEEAHYRSLIPAFDNLYTDLNRDDVTAVPKFGDRPEIFLPNTALGADLIVSMAKMKTHHWAGATLSMKNLFGLVPGAVYGWPKNFLHSVGIATSIVELNRIFRRTFAIVDGIVAMEGNGPIQGSPKEAGVLVMGPDVVAVDATCCRIMGIDPQKVKYLELAHALGRRESANIEQRGERVEAVATRFNLIDSFAEARLRS